ncbi:MULTISPECIES: response regulator transcription factor [Cupriavidus]|uniref:response regulator transcription factor n=1 Tax=unclassified Cupriavidus TaxID=2640874 RepID=UPI0021015095|nr:MULTISPECIES: helix-turn-helix transcriptional regulator [unclassified Cupriavidus]
MTTRESQVLALIAKGMSTSDIARYLGVTEFTARKHRTNISAKLDIHSTSQLVAFATAHANTATHAPIPILQPDTLSQREKDVLQKLSLGLTAKEIGRHLSISPRTVSKHLENIRAKTGLQTLADLMTISRQIRIPVDSNPPNTHSE